MKSMYDIANDPENLRYSEPIRNDIAKLIPKFKQDFENIEKVVLASNKNEEVQDTQILAAARKADANFEIFNNTLEWYNKICKPKKSKKE